MLAHVWFMPMCSQISTSGSEACVAGKPGSPLLPRGQSPVTLCKRLPPSFRCLLAWPRPQRAMCRPGRLNDRE